MSESSIRVLASDVIDRIAAGEVIERPASVVKELVENALDAGARRVEVDLEAGGLSRIIVSDDGCGMAPEDAHLCLQRHATSKLRQAEDLFEIRTLGFRGEALSSIAAVTRLRLTTRRPEDAAGIRIEVEGGDVIHASEVGCPSGTTLELSDLFFNTPARRKFMRSPATEQAHAVDAALRVVLGARRGGLILTAGQRRLLDIPEDSEPEQRVVSVLGRDVDRVFPFEREVDGIRVSGFVTRPEVDRGSTRGMSFFVNGRYVRDRMLQRAALDGYRGMKESGRYPVAVIYIDADPSCVDVNVHPQKLEVRFGDSNAVFRAVSSAITGVLAQTPWVGEGTGTAGVVSALRRYWHERGPMALASELGGQPYATTPSASARSAAPEHQETLPGVSARGYFASLRPLGQALGLYLVCHGEDEIVLIDQHAAAERVAFERLRRQAAEGAIERQSLLFPESIEVPSRLQALLEERWESLQRYGFEIEPTAPQRFAIRAVPAALSGADAARLAADLLEELDAIDGAGVDMAAQDAQARLLSRCACHAVVRAGDRLGPEETAALLADLDRVDFGANCPHGRPVYHCWRRADLDKLFHR